MKSILFEEKMNRKYKKKIVYTSMHGVGADTIDLVFDACGFQPVIHVKEQRRKYVSKVWKIVQHNHKMKWTNIIPVFIILLHSEPDPTFPTVPFPNPEEGKSALYLAQQTAESNESIYILANDPDADRLAVAQRLPRYKPFLISCYK